MKCNNLAKFKYIWPGQLPAFCCDNCAKSIIKLASIMGFYLPITVLSFDEIKSQKKCTCQIERT